MTLCTCPHQLQPHDWLPNVCPISGISFAEAIPRAEHDRGLDEVREACDDCGRSIGHDMEVEH